MLDLELLEPTYTPGFQQVPHPRSEDLKIKYPLLYKAEKDNRAHHILGLIHRLPISSFPQKVLDVVNQCNTLLIEDIASVPEDIQQKLMTKGPYYNGNGAAFINAIRDRESFQQDILPILTLLDIKEQNLQNISPVLLFVLFENTIKKRLKIDQMRMDEAFISHFKTQRKRVVELNKETEDKTLLDAILENDQTITNLFRGNARLKARAKQALEHQAAQINQHYEDASAREEMIRSQKLHTLIHTDLAKDNPLSHTEGDTAFNTPWTKIFVDMHNAGEDNLLLSVGELHLVEKTHSILDLLKAEGFTITRVPSLEDEIADTFNHLKIA